MKRFLVGRLRAALVVVGLAVAAACSGGQSSPSPNASGTSPLLIGILAPFSGQDAQLGPAYVPACLAATREINAAGGVMGHPLSCKQFDTRGDPADAVPAVRQMIASNSNLMMVIGCTSDEASSVMPVLQQSHVVAFCQTGQSEFNKSSFSYFHRLVPPDEYDAYAMVGIAMLINHYNRIGLVFGNDIGSQTFVNPAMKAIKAMGGTVTINQALALGQASYRTEVQRLIDSNPQAIFTEALGSTDATYLAELKQLKGTMLPVIGTSATIDPVWFKAVTDAIGVNDLVNNYQADDTPSDFSGPGYNDFKTNLLASATDDPDAPKYQTRGATIHLYDGIIMTALAMNAAGSIDPKTYNSKIIDIGDGVSGAATVNTYKDGVDAITGGKSVRYMGAGGPTKFDKWNNSQTGFILAKYDAQGNEVTVSTLTQDQINGILKKAGVI